MIDDPKAVQKEPAHWRLGSDPWCGCSRTFLHEYTEYDGSRTFNRLLTWPGVGYPVTCKNEWSVKMLTVSAEKGAIVIVL
jgi:hypothetical protein